jgi:hypothetical protein
MPFGKYNLRSPGVNKSLAKAANRAKKLNGEVIVIKKADPEKLVKYRAEQRIFNDKLKAIKKAGTNEIRLG